MPHSPSNLMTPDSQILLALGRRVGGALAGLNRAYFSTFQLKRTRRLVEGLAVTPPRLADRLEALFAAPRDDALADLEALVTETLALVAEHMPSVDVAGAGRRLGWRQQPCDPADFPAGAANGAG